VILAGLALFGTSVFVTQAVASSHVAVNAAEGRAFAIGLYATCYYVGGSVGGSLPAVMWSAGGWPACVLFVVGVQVVMLSIATFLW
jgi:MFS transporter, YNFM family, putative membrane transport protein